MTIWFNRTTNGQKQYCSKSISLRYYFKHWKLLLWSNNGALKGRKEDTCYSLTVHFLGIFFNYTNWDFNRKFRYNPTKNYMRELKIKRVLGQK